MKKKIVVSIITAIMTATMTVMPVCAATPSVGGDGGFENNGASTNVYLQASDDALQNISATVPLKVTLAVKADGTVMAPTNYQIKNTSAFPLHVTDVSTKTASGYTFNQTKGNNTLDLALASAADKVILADGSNKINQADWNVASNAANPLSFSGSVGYITNDITKEDQAFTVMYTIAAGIAK